MIFVSFHSEHSEHESQQDSVMAAGTAFVHVMSSVQMPDEDNTEGIVGETNANAETAANNDDAIAGVRNNPIEEDITMNDETAAKGGNLGKQ